VDWEGLTKIKKKKLKKVSKEEAKDEERVEEPKKYGDIL